MTEYFDWGLTTDRSPWDMTADEIKAETKREADSYGVSKDSVEPSSEKTLDQEIAEAFTSTTEILISHNKNSITQFQAIIKDRLDSGEDEYFLSHFQQQVEDLESKNKLLIEACREVKDNPTEETVNRVKDRIR